MLSRVIATAARPAVRMAAPAVVATRQFSAKAIAEFNADVACDYPAWPVWGPRAPLAVTEKYEEELKTFFELHWEEVQDMDVTLRRTLNEFVTELTPDEADMVEMPHPKNALAVTDATEKYFDRWMGGAKEQRVLFPLCGGWSAEMGAFANMGHQVVGVEYCRAAVDALSTYEILPPFVEEGWRENYLIHHSPESGAIVAEGDFFKATAGELGTFDKVFDRCGISSVPQARIGEYAETLYGLMKPGATLLLETMSATGDSEGDNDTYSWCTPEALSKVFAGDKWTFEELGTEDVTTTWPYSDTNLKGLKLHNFLITRN